MDRIKEMETEEFVLSFEGNAKAAHVQGLITWINMQSSEEYTILLALMVGNIA